MYQLWVRIILNLHRDLKNNNLDCIGKGLSCNLTFEFACYFPNQIGGIDFLNLVVNELISSFLIKNLLLSEEKKLYSLPNNQIVSKKLIALNYCFSPHRKVFRIKCELESH